MSWPSPVAANALVGDIYDIDLGGCRRYGDKEECFENAKGFPDATRSLNLQRSKNRAV